MSSDLIKNARQWGIVGAGGAGFPMYVKLGGSVSTFIINAAECEPLLHKDKEMMRAFADEMMEGARMIMRQIGAKEGIIGIKAKYTQVIEILEKLLSDNIRIHPLKDYYPTGDEFILVYEATGKVIPPGGLPKDVDCAVQNVETVINLARAKPVTRKYLSVVGAVHHPVTIAAPLGTPFRDCIAMAGGAKVDDFGVLSGGCMMGKRVKSLDEPVTRTTGALIVLPSDHDLLNVYDRPKQARDRIGRSACDQCSFCTEFCPRYLLGHPIEPHKAMRSLGFVHDRQAQVIGTTYCCECNLCTLMACPESLDPRDACVGGKAEVKANGWKWNGMPRPVHPVFDGRHVPVKRLMSRLNLNQFENVGPLLPDMPESPRLTIMLSQHIGAPAVPIVKAGASVKEGDIIANVGEKDLGVPIHASAAGRVAEITQDAIVIER
ncbi:4Fe-4S dicluster domain-containing protein [bacterium]|nr:4Fe-4S dicluster domain-containing protein [bacterium]